MRWMVRVECTQDDGTSSVVEPATIERSPQGPVNHLGLPLNNPRLSRNLYAAGRRSTEKPSASIRLASRRASFPWSPRGDSVG